MGNQNTCFGSIEKWVSGTYVLYYSLLVGSFSVAALVISPLANGLFRRAIHESGTTINPGWHALNADEGMIISNQFAERLGCNQGDLNCLQDKNVDQVLTIDLTDIIIK